MAKKINDAEFESVLSENDVVLVDFGAVWCGPCRLLSPVIDEISDEFDGKVYVAKCDVDDNIDAPMKYGIKNIPTLLFFKGGVLVDRIVGSVPKTDIVSKLESIL